MRSWRRICCILVGLLVCTAAMGAFAESAGTTEKTFDYSAYEGMEGFEEDPFDKTWQYVASVDGQKIDMSIGTHGDAEGKLNAVMMSLLSQAEGEKLQFLIGDTTYTFDVSEQLREVGTDVIIMTPENLKFFEALAEADGLSVRKICDGERYTDTYSKEELEPFQKSLKDLLSQQPLECMNENGLYLIDEMERNGYQELEIR